MKNSPNNGQEILLKSIDELVFDHDNPRLPKKLRKPEVKEDEILEWMLTEENVTELMGSIAEKGFFHAEPLLLVKSERKKGKFEVVEGNRRLAAVILLNYPNKAPKKETAIKELADRAREAGTIRKEVPTLLFEDKSDLQIFLGYRHVTGIKEWDALPKARYLKKLQGILKIKNKDEEYKRLSRIIGSNPSYVKSILKGLAVYEVIEENDFFKIHDLEETRVEFGVLYTAVGRENISTFVGVDIYASNPVSKIKIRELKELTSWLFEKNEENQTRLGESRNIKLLDAILDKKNPAALKAFRAGVSIREAALLTDEPKIAFKKSIFKAKDNLIIAQSQIHLIKDISEDELNWASELNALSKDIVSLIRLKLEGNG